ncbi:cytochrome c [Tropicimonas sp. IMCC6043]|uniref:c-type cytochrome n=1 Tax=Tropicimonas sp. IMCC6043 TaxID=2510645 RepID=UPI00101C2C6C|nr:cytochrome c [Tropicimonas sp. IMCC6043]RYH09616.1 c-type cytochrome [Tropicimonas sp. IMCC6043]
MQFVKLLLTAIPALLCATISYAEGSGDHSHDEPTATHTLDVMREMHAGHDHEHDFEAMDDVSEEDMRRTMDFLMDIGLVVPTMDSHRGAEAFMKKGCIVCHSVNGVGGAVGPSFDAADMAQPMNAFEFAARMWRGAPAMAQMQEDLLGEMIALNGQELADIVAFVHDADVQSEISKDDIPGELRDLVP